MAYAILNGQIVGPAETYETATIVSGTLQAGETEIVLTSPYIFTDSHIAPYVDEKIYPSAPSKVTTENGSATLTFDSPFEEDVEVGVEVLGTKDYATLEQSAIQSLSDRISNLKLCCDFSNEIAKVGNSQNLSYTATEDCFIMFHCACDANTEGATGYINDVMVMRWFTQTSLSAGFAGPIRVKKGDVIRMTNKRDGGAGCEIVAYGLR